MILNKFIPRISECLIKVSLIRNRTYKINISSQGFLLNAFQVILHQFNHEHFPETFDLLKQLIRPKIHGRLHFNLKAKQIAKC